MLEGIVLGIIQGVAEWLPVSSEGLIVLVQVNFFGGHDLSEIIKNALFLHLGTFLAALIYFRRDVWQLLKSLLNFKQADQEQQSILKFLIITTLISGLIGYLIIQALESFTVDLNNFSKIITALVAVLLFITAGLQLKSHSSGKKQAKDITNRDSYWLAMAQGLAALPGLSRSGLTVSALLLRNFDKTWALKLSFLMSLPIVLVGNIILNFNISVLTPTMWWGLLFSFISGLITIDLLLRFARRINFGYFVLFFAIITLAAVLI
jgi:undecaprenyl-diphosphatase